VRRDDAHVRLDIDEALRVEVLRVDDRRVDVGEHLELARAAHVVAVAGGAVADDAAALGLLHLPGLVRFDHAVLLGHAPDPAVALDAHAVFPAAHAASRGIVGGATAGRNHGAGAAPGLASDQRGGDAPRRARTPVQLLQQPARSVAVGPG